MLFQETWYCIYPVAPEAGLLGQSVAGMARQKDEAIKPCHFIPYFPYLSEIS